MQSCVVFFSVLAVTMTAFSFGLTRAAFTRGIVKSTSTIIPPFLTQSFVSGANNNQDKPNMPSSLKSYFQLVVDEHGETSIVQREFSKVEKVDYSNTPQLVKKLDPSTATPVDVIFTSLQGENPFHHCPAPQIVVCLGGEGWYIETTDGQVTELHDGDVLYQDNVEEHPAAEKGTRRAMHFSASLGNQPCDQMIVQLQLTDGPVANSKAAPGPM